MVQCNSLQSSLRGTNQIMNNPTLNEIKALRAMPLAELMAMARQTKLKERGKRFSLCSIINAKSGRCGEDCRFCAQSAHYKTASPVYPLKSCDEIIAAAREAKEIGAGHFSIVTSGRGTNSEETEILARIIEQIGKQTDINICASLGIMSAVNLKRLREAGLVRYHHNLETSKEFFPNVVSTHSFSERLETIAAAQEAGLEVCAGGIVGLGESEDDRISMALTLRECGVDSIPLNILIPLPGTPMADNRPLAVVDILRTIALYRLIMPSVALRLAAGRAEPFMRDFLSSAFLAGADAMMIGGYLTQGCRPPTEDRRFVADMQELWSA